MINKIRIFFLKKKCKYLLTRYYDLTSAYSCGSHLTNYISPTAATVWENYKKEIGKLSKLDPDYPKEIDIIDV